MDEYIGTVECFTSSTLCGIELNRHIEADNANIYTFVPFHGTPLRKMCEDLGLIKPETITKCITQNPSIIIEFYSNYGKKTQKLFTYTRSAKGSVSVDDSETKQKIKELYKMIDQ